MSNTTFYLKYRPQTLEELDSEAVRESLKKTVASGKMPHAFLFAGPKGTGKTSAARIIAKIVNCQSIILKKRKSGEIEPCGKCEQCTSITQDSNIDVIELDAASHRGIDDIKAIRDAVKLSPAKAPNKVYIIDEAHMLTLEAANALLKTLEEPPSHVYFILATTNPEKLIDTIRSRTTIIQFKKASKEEVVRSLTRVVKGEKIKIEKESLELIAKAASGSFRDAVKVLEQLVIEEQTLSLEEIKEYLFQRKSFDVEDFVDLLIKKDTKMALQEVDNGIKLGVLAVTMIDGTLEKLREGLLAFHGLGGEMLSGINDRDIIALSKLLIRAAKDMQGSPIEELPLEIAVIEWCEGSMSGQKTKVEIVVGKSGISSSEAKIISTQTLSQETPIPTSKPTISIGELKDISDEIWRKILSTVKPINTSIEALLRAAKPLSFDGETLTLGVFYKFHKERLEDFHHRKILEEVVAQILGAPTKVVCRLTEPPIKKLEEVVPKDKDVVLTEGQDEDIIRVAKEIFGN